jgi:hypothetical protein
VAVNPTFEPGKSIGGTVVIANAGEADAPNVPWMVTLVDDQRKILGQTSGTIPSIGAGDQLNIPWHTTVLTPDPVANWYVVVRFDADWSRKDGNCNHQIPEMYEDDNRLQVDYYGGEMRTERLLSHAEPGACFD